MYQPAQLRFKVWLLVCGCKTVSVLSLTEVANWVSAVDGIQAKPGTFRCDKWMHVLQVKLVTFNTSYLSITISCFILMSPPPAISSKRHYAFWPSICCVFVHCLLSINMYFAWSDSSVLSVSDLPHHYKALNSFICADVPLRNYTLTHSVLNGGISMTLAMNIYNMRFFKVKVTERPNVLFQRKHTFQQCI